MNRCVFGCGGIDDLKWSRHISHSFTAPSPVPHWGGSLLVYMGITLTTTSAQCVCLVVALAKGRGTLRYDDCKPKSLSCQRGFAALREAYSW